MEILSFKTILGPNVYTHHPVVIMKLDLQQWDEIGSHQIPGLKERLLALLPGLQEHRCSVGQPGGFLERLDRGTYFAHIIEHVALELSTQAGIEATFGKARYAGRKGVYDVITRFQSEEGMKECLRQAVNLVEAVAMSQQFDMAHAIAEIKYMMDRNKLGPSTEAIVNAAIKRGIPVRRLNKENSLIQLGQGKNRRLIQASMTDRTSLIATDLVQDKEATKEFLKRYSIPAPYGCLIRHEDELMEVMTDLNPPWVVKPFDGHHGNGVALNLTTFDELKTAFHLAKSYSPTVLVEEMCQGQDYRVLVIDGKFAAAALRIPPTVIGDGTSTIEQLIAKLNEDPRRDEGHSGVLTKVIIDANLTEHLLKQKKELSTVPAAGEKVTLRGAANLSSGGTARDVTETAHPDVKRICERIARLINLDICGIDIIHRDLSEPVNEYFKVIEVNTAPGLRMHIAPNEGNPQPIGEKIIDMLYPNSASSRIPLISITGTNGKTTVARLVKKILSLDGKNVGLTTTDGIWIGDHKIVSGDTTGPFSTETILADPSVEIAVLEVARGGILRGGLAYDWSDVSIITNIRPDHLGQDGIETLEDIVWIKSLVAERVKENGTLILNADDPASLSVKNNAKVLKGSRNIFLYSTTSKNPAIQDHLNQGGNACWSDGEWIYMKAGDLISSVIKIDDIPITMGGTIDFQVSNAIAAIAGSHAMGASLTQIRQGLRAFSLNENAGRLNLFRIGGGHVILDYAHNPDAISALGKSLRSWKNLKIKGVLGLPGDRNNDLLEKSAIEIATYFDEVILKDDYDLRGRQEGEVPNFLHGVIKKVRPDMKCEVILDEEQALHTALKNIKPEDILVVLFEKLDRVMDVLKHYDPMSVSDIRPGTRAMKSNQTSSSQTIREFNHLLGHHH